MNIIKTSVQLLDFCKPLLAASNPLAIGIDTEFVRKRTYWPKLCLIQITSPLSPEAIIIDPLTDLDLRPFQNLLACRRITKVIHSARQDLEIFWHEYGILPQSFFDTQIAAMVCGLGEGMGYSALVKTLFNCDLPKDAQYTNWSLRPLTDRQMAYAQADVLYLLPAFDLLSQRLTALNRWDWMADDLSILLNPITYEMNPQQAWLRIHTHRHKPKNLALLKDICAWREINAVYLNVNRGQILRDECILKIATNLPQTVQELKLLADSSLLTDALANSLFAIYENALKKPKELWPLAPQKTILSSLARHRLAQLRERVDETAATLNVPARLIAPKPDLIALAQGHWEGNRIMAGWRYKVFGYKVHDILGAVPSTD